MRRRAPWDAFAPRISEEWPLIPWALSRSVSAGTNGTPLAIAVPLSAGGSACFRQQRRREEGNEIAHDRSQRAEEKNVENVLSMADFKHLIAEQLGVEESRLTEETTFLLDLGIDSLSLINFVVWMEKKYGFKVEMDNVFRLKSVRDAYQAFTTRMNAVAGAQGKGVQVP
jgi:acyl carrier protein